MVGEVQGTVNQRITSVEDFRFRRTVTPVDVPIRLPSSFPGGSSESGLGLCGTLLRPPETVGFVSSVEPNLSQVSIIGSLPPLFLSAIRVSLYLPRSLF